MYTDSTTIHESETGENSGHRPEGRSVRHGRRVRPAILTDERMQILEKELGTAKSALNSLSAEGAENLLKLIATGRRTAALAVGILNAVNRSSRGRENEALDRLAHYPGSLTILEDFLNRMGTDDPFIATERAQVVVLPVSQLPGSEIIAEEEGNASEVRTATHESVRGASGHIITGLIYCAYQADSPAESIGFFSKRQAVTRPFEAFNPERFNVERTSQVKERRERNFRTILKDLALEDLERDPSIAGALGSPVLIRDLAVYSELKRAIAEYREKAALLTYGEEVQFAGPQGLRVRTDSGGSFLGWFERQLENGCNLPEGILVAYQSIRDPDVYLDPATERDYTRGLMAYQRVHSFISKETALTGIALDLEEFEALAPGDPLALDLRVVEAKREIQEMAADSQSDIRVTDLGAVLSRAGLSEFRRAMNGRILERYGDEFSRALTYFEFLFQKEGGWLEDSVQDSVPMGRLSKTIYGAKTGKTGSPAGNGELKAPLSRSDFRCIMDGLLLRMTSNENETRLAQSMPVKNFREMVEGVVCARRKAGHFDECLRMYIQENPGSQSPGVEVDRLNAETLPAGFQPLVPWGKDLRPSEVFMEEERTAGSTVLSFRELIARVKGRNLGEQKVRAELPQLATCAEAGVYPVKMDRVFRALHKAAIRYISADDLRTELDTVRGMLESPFVRIHGYREPDFLEKPCYNNAERLTLETLASFKPRFDELSLQVVPETAALASRLEELRYGSVFSGRIVPSPGAPGARFRLETATFNSFFDGRAECGLEYFDPRTLTAKFEELDRDYVRTDTLSKVWFTRARTVCSSHGKQILSRHGMTLVDRTTYQNAMWLEPSPSRYVSSEFVEAVNRLFE